MLSCLQVAEHFRKAQLEMKFALDREMRLLMEHAAKQSKAMIGVEHPEWPDLAAETIAEKKRKGYKVPAPLLREGQLQDSIDSATESTAWGVEGVVGSDDEIAKYHEMGASGAHIPARPFLSPPLMKIEEHASTVFGELAIRALTPGARP